MLSNPKRKGGDESSSQEVHALMQELFASSGFYDCLCESVRMYRRVGYTLSQKQSTTRLVEMHWVDALTFLFMFGDNAEGGDKENAEKILSCREAFLKQLLSSAIPARS